MKKNNGVFICISLFFFILPFLSGCTDDRPKDMPNLYKVSLTFTQEGKPCSKAAVALVPLDSSPWIVGGVTDDNGVIQLKTHGQYIGVPAGKYRIAVKKMEKDESSAKQGGGAMSDMMNPVVDSYHLIDIKYASRKESPLEIEIVNGKNSFEPFELGTPVRIRMKQPGEK